MRSIDYTQVRQSGSGKSSQLPHKLSKALSQGISGVNALKSDQHLVVVDVQIDQKLVIAIGGKSQLEVCLPIGRLEAPTLLDAPPGTSKAMAHSAGLDFFPVFVSNALTIHS